jgi:regulatory protein
VAGEITALTRDAKKRNRVNVYVDGEHRFSLAQNLADNLNVGQVYSEKVLADIQRKDEEERTYRRALDLISRRPRSEYELRKNFERHQVGEEVQNAVLRRLRTLDLVNDEAFAKAWVENRRAFRPRSGLMLKHELREKRVPPEVIEIVLEGYDDMDAALAAVEKPARRWKSYRWKEFQKRVSSYLVRRGFPHSIVSTVVKQAWRRTTGDIDESEVKTWM